MSNNPPRYQQDPTEPAGLPARLRDARGWRVAKEMAEALGWPNAKISKIEHGKQLPSEQDLRAWADFTEVGEDVLHDWRILLEAAEAARHDYARQTRLGQRALQRRYNDIIAATTTFRLFETTFFPRFLQLPAYTKAVLTESRERHGGIDDVDAAVADRQASLSYLFDDKRSFELLMSEPVLGWRPQALTREVHLAQLRHTREMVGLRPNVRVGIVPLFRPVVWAPQNGFQLLGDLGFMEHWIGERQYVLADEISRLNHVMDQLWESACEGDEARALIDAAIERLERADD
jgi:transcriptional regulator with XRE-family HTH domain